MDHSIELRERCSKHLAAAKLVLASGSQPVAACGGYASGHCRRPLFCAQTAHTHVTGCMPATDTPTLPQWKDAFEWVRTNLATQGALPSFCSQQVLLSFFTDARPPLKVVASACGTTTARSSTAPSTTRPCLELRSRRGRPA